MPPIAIELRIYLHLAERCSTSPDNQSSRRREGNGGSRLRAGGRNPRPSSGLAPGLAWVPVFSALSVVPPPIRAKQGPSMFEKTVRLVIVNAEKLAPQQRERPGRRPADGR